MSMIDTLTKEQMDDYISTLVFKIEKLEQDMKDLLAENDSLKKLVEAGISSEDKLHHACQEIDKLKDTIRQMHKDYGCELRDPNGTIWEHAASVQRENEQLKAVISAAQKTGVTILSDIMDIKRAYQAMVDKHEATIAAMGKWITEHCQHIYGADNCATCKQQECPLYKNGGVR